MTSQDRQDAPLWAWQHLPGAEEVPPLHLEPVDFAQINGWGDDDLQDALRANSPLLPVDTGVLGDAAAARRWLESRFRAYRLKDAEPGLLTAYYQPELCGSRAAHGPYRIPVYRRPPDLLPLDPADASAHALIRVGLTAGKLSSTGWTPYADRAEIENGALAGRGLEILFVDDAVDAFLLHVQGSGLVHLAEGGSVGLAFDGKNGHPYSSVGRLMIERGLLDATDANLERVLEVLRADPVRARALLNENKSYIFFRERETGAGPCGSSGAPLVRGRSLAVDPRHHAFGSLIWVDAPGLELDGRPFRRLLAAHDSGSAIRGPQRGDLFCGTGWEAGLFAGRVRHPCSFIVLREANL